MGLNSICLDILVTVLVQGGICALSEQRVCTTRVALQTGYKQNGPNIAISLFFLYILFQDEDTR